MTLHTDGKLLLLLLPALKDISKQKYIKNKPVKNLYNFTIWTKTNGDGPNDNKETF